MMRLLASALLLAAAPAAADRVIDLSHAYDADTVYWPTESGFVLEKKHDGVTAAGYYYAANRFCSPEHGGTHLDAPVHFGKDRRAVDAIPVSQLIGPGVVIDVTDACARDRDYQVRVDDIVAWERQHGKIPRGAIVFLRTGFGRFWPDRVRYMGTAERGAAAVAKLHFPGLAPDAARFLAVERRIGAVGIDTPSIDHGPSTTFATHVLLSEHEVPALENVANLEPLPARGFTAIALPMKIRGGSGGPVRIVAVLSDAR
ncbi:MAG TPA: cyclase family protein [Candidatus Limnocylindria bacterium]|nr:cyclase family protein [Candidatus Limnocylindria bacterium]